MEAKSEDKSPIVRLIEWCKDHLQARECYYGSVGHGRGFVEVHTEMRNHVQRRRNRYVQALCLSRGLVTSLNNVVCPEM